MTKGRKQGISIIISFCPMFGFLMEGVCEYYAPNYCADGELPLNSPLFTWVKPKTGHITTLAPIFYIFVDYLEHRKLKYQNKDGPAADLKVSLHIGYPGVDENCFFEIEGADRLL